MSNTALRQSLIRLAHANPDLRKDILPLLASETGGKTALTQAEKDLQLIKRMREQKKRQDNPAPTGWRNYNTIGTRQYVKGVLDLVESAYPAALRILFRETNETEFDKTKKKWWSKGRDVTKKGIKGRLVRKGGKTLLIAQVGGKWAIVSNQFKV